MAPSMGAVEQELHVFETRSLSYCVTYASCDFSKRRRKGRTQLAPPKGLFTRSGLMGSCSWLQHLGFVVSVLWQHRRFYSTTLHPSVSINSVTLNNPLLDTISKTETRYPAPRTCSNSSKQIVGTRRVRCRNGISHICVVLLMVHVYLWSFIFHGVFVCFPRSQRTYVSMCVFIAASLWVYVLHVFLASYVYILLGILCTMRCSVYFMR